MNTLVNALHATAVASATVLWATTALAEVQTRTITFENEGVTLSGTLYLPDNHDGAPLPTVVVTGAWTSVEEQMPRTYALAMVERGLAAFTFDFRGWGKSGDLPQNLRFVEDPAAKTSDIRAALEIVAGLPEVDPAQLHGLGICASAGYMIDATAGNPLVARVGLVAPWLQNHDIVEAVYGGTEGVAALRQLAAEAATVPGGVVIPAAGEVGAEGVLMPIGGYYFEPSRGAIPEYDNRWNNLSWEPWLTYHPTDSAPMFDKPLAIVHSEAAAIPDGVRAFLAGFAGEATLQWLENVDQFSFYDREDAVNTASDVIARHFTDTMNTKAETTELAPVGDIETARVISIVSSIPLAVDLAAYDLAEQAFAPSIVIDYTSLWGGEPQTMTPQDLMDAWRGIVPGFTATWHELSNVQAVVTGDRAQASAFVDGRHWLDEALWRPVGHYLWELERRNGRWMVTSMTFQMTEEFGDRTLAQRAMERVAQGLNN